MSSVVVLGAGPAGAASALFLARRGFSVTILDREPRLPSSPGKDDERSGSDRHVRQGHSFLALGTGILERELPELADALLAEGAERVPLRHDPQQWNLLSRRSLFDRVLREALTREPRISFLAETHVTGFLFDAAPERRCPHVSGVAARQREIRADLVIDASGRKTLVPQWLKSAGVSLAMEDDHTPFVYITRHYSLREGEEFPSRRVPIIEALDYATVLAFPEDNGHFQLSVQLDCRDPAKRAMLEPGVFDRFMAAVPLTAPWLAAGRPVGDPEVFASIGNRRTRTWCDGPLVTGLLTVGDAALHTNPTAGRGVALALAHAQALARFLERAGRPTPEDTARQWDLETTALLGPWYNSQIRIDNERRTQIRASMTGEVWEPSDEPSNRLAKVLASWSAPDALQAVADRLLNLLITPAEVFSDRTVMRHLFREARKIDRDAAAAGPSRHEFENMTKVRNARS